jgi:hypothetical protein
LRVVGSGGRMASIRAVFEPHTRADSEMSRASGTMTVE